MGSRLWNISNQTPKCLLPYQKGTILSTIIGRLTTCGITEVYIVVGYKQEYIRDYVNQNYWNIPVSFIDNPYWERGNGLSVYQVKNHIQADSFILSMSDHIVSVEALSKIVEYPEKTNLLLVDPFYKEVLDIDDATKVSTIGCDIKSIGKTLSDYNGIDCGIFRLEQDFFSAVDKALLMDNESISGAVTELIDSCRFKAVFVDKPHQWLDIDTPEAYQHALQWLE